MGEIPDAKLQIQYLALNKKQNKTLSETKMNNTLIIDLDVKYKQKKTSLPESRFSLCDLMFFKVKTNTSWFHWCADYCLFIQNTIVTATPSGLQRFSFTALPNEPRKVLTAQSLFHAPLTLCSYIYQRLTPTPSTTPPRSPKRPLRHFLRPQKCPRIRAPPPAIEDGQLERLDWLLQYPRHPPTSRDRARVTQEMVRGLYPKLYT